MSSLRRTPKGASEGYATLRPGYIGDKVVSVAVREFLLFADPTKYKWTML